MKKFLPWFIVLVCLFVSWESFSLYRKEFKNKQRILNNWESSSKSLSYYKTVAGNEAAKGDVLKMQLYEISKTFPTVLEQIKNLKIKPGRVEDYTQTAIETEKRIITILKDSLMYDTVWTMAIGYKDPYYQISGYIINDSLIQKITSYDTLTQLVYRGKRIKPWAWILSRRHLEQTITSANPNSKITYNRTIKIIDK